MCLLGPKMLWCFTDYSSLKGLFQRFSLAFRYRILLMHVSIAKRVLSFSLLSYIFSFVPCGLFFSPFFARDIFYELLLCLQIFLFGTNSFKSPGTFLFLQKSTKDFNSWSKLTYHFPVDTLWDPVKLLTIGQLSVS